VYLLSINSYWEAAAFMLDQMSVVAPAEWLEAIDHEE
jgi:hypothetical protein